MISIIICSKEINLKPLLIENIKKTIGCDYELVVINNSRNTYSIFEAYNLGVSKSSGSFLCFIHDDILFHSQNWGVILTSIFDSNIKIGLIGVAGSKVKTKMPSAWWDCNEEDRVINIIQNFKSKDKEIQNYGFESVQNVEVKVIDGVLMAIRNDNRISFSNKIKGFHTYDLNLSFEVIKYGYSVVVTNEILIEHFSSGEINESWVKSSYVLHRLYRKQLPFFVKGNTVSRNHEITNAQRFINKCLQFKLKKLALKVWFQLFLFNPISMSNFRLLNKIIKTF